MTTGEWIGQICGVLIVVVMVITMQLPKRWQMLCGNAVLNLLSTVNQFLVGSGFAACLVCGLATIHCPFNAYKVKKGKPITMTENIVWTILYLVAWGIGAAIPLMNGAFSPMDLFPLLSTFCYFGTVFCARERDIRLCSFANSFVYFIYDGIAF